MIFIAIVIFAQFLYSIAFLGDKFVIERTITHPSVFAFFANIAGGLGILFWIFDLKLPTPAQMLLAIFSGAAFTIGTYFYFKALKYAPASHATPIYGGTSAFFTFLLTTLLGRQIEFSETSGIILLIISIFLFAVAPEQNPAKKIPHLHGLWPFLAGAIMSLSVVSYEALIKSAGFPTGFALVRLFALVAALAFLLSFNFRNCLKLENGLRRNMRQKSALFGRLFGAGGNVLNAYAISLGSASVVQAMQGIQYVFMLPLSLAFSKHFPGVYNENKKTKSIIIKSIATVIIVSGLALISFEL